jgi:hypothetical protein
VKNIGATISVESFMRATTGLIANAAELDAIDAAQWNSPAVLVIAYCHSNWTRAEPTLLALRAHLPAANMIAISTAGHFGATPDIYDEPVMLQLIGFDRGEIRLRSGTTTADGGAAALARELGGALNDDALRGLLAFTDGSHMDGAAFVEGIRDSVAAQVVMAGGMAGDGDRFADTWIWDGQQKIQSGAIAIGLYGAARMSSESGGGWASFGVDRDITSANGTMLNELDGQPALSLYREYLGDRAADLPASGMLFPLSVTSEHSSEPVVRTILGIDETNGTIRLAGKVTVGSKARLMRANPNRLIEAAGEATARARAAVSQRAARSEQPAATQSGAAMIVNCVGRRVILRQRAEEEIDIALTQLGGDTALAGFYSYGEFGPSGLTNCALHNQTFTITVFGEDDAVSSPP